MSKIFSLNIKEKDMLSITGSLIDQLNGDLAREYAAAIQYMQHSAVIDGLYCAFIDELSTHAEEELAHAKLLNDHINYLGGIPVVNPSAILTSPSAVEMLQQDLQGEQTAINNYKQRIQYCRNIGDYGTEEILLSILKDEESHANDLQTILKKGVE